MTIHWQRVSFSIEYPLVEGERILRIEYEIEVLQCFREEIALHLAAHSHVILVSDVMDRRVPVGLSGVIFE